MPLARPLLLPLRNFRLSLRSSGEISRPGCKQLYGRIYHHYGILFILFLSSLRSIPPPSLSPNGRANGTISLCVLAMWEDYISYGSWSSCLCMHVTYLHAKINILLCKNVFQGERTSRKPSKTYIRYAVRQKRAEAKKALKDFLLYGKSSKFHVQDEDLYWCADGISSRNANVENGSFGFDSIPRSRKSGKSKPYSSSYSGKAKHGGSKRWQNGQTYYDEDDCGHPETIFEAVFGGHKGFTWSYASRENFHFNHSTSGSEWSNRTRWEKAWKRVWNDSDVYDDSTNVGSHSDRVTLGLPPTGPLKLEDVKSAYHASALKWHPDKHQGPSQAMAAEKFKHCVNAYNSLSNALKAA